MRWVAICLCLLARAGAARADTPSDRAARAAAYDDQAVGVRTIVPLGSAERPAAPNWDAFQGRDHHPVDREVFLRIVGREDLARRYHRKNVLRETLMGTGGTVMVAGLFYAAIVLLARTGAQPAIDCMGSACAPESAPSAARWGFAAAAAGFATLLIGHTLDPSPIEASEADALARDHDERLKAQLGVSDPAAE